MKLVKIKKNDADQEIVKTFGKVKTADGPPQDFEAEQFRKAAANKILKLYGDFRTAQREAERMHKLQNSEHTKRIMKRFEEADFYIRALVNSF